MIVVVPMAGRGSRLSGLGLPKPLVPVAGRPMVAWALESLRGLSWSRLVFVALAEHERDHGVSATLRGLGVAVEVVLIPEVTAGQLCTVLEARAFLDSDEDVLIASSDTLVVSDLARDIAGRHPDCRGIISVADLPGDRWSFARTDADGRVVEVAEKVRISDHASTGLYYFASGREFVELGESMIRRGERTGGEFYVIPLYQDFIRRGSRVDISRATEVRDMGTPEALKDFERWAAAVGVGSSEAGR